RSGSGRTSGLCLWKRRGRPALLKLWCDGAPATRTISRTSAAHSVGEAEPAVGRSDQPQRPDEQELEILEEGRATTLDSVTDELHGPGEHEDDERAQPQRPGKEGEA